MAVIVDPLRLDPHHGRDKRSKEERLRLARVEHPSESSSGDRNGLLSWPPSQHALDMKSSQGALLRRSRRPSHRSRRQFRASTFFSQVRNDTGWTKNWKCAKALRPKRSSGCWPASVRAFGNRLSTAQAVREQHGNTLTWVGVQPPDAVVFPTSDRGRRRGRAGLRRPRRAGHPLRHGHLVRGPRQRSVRRRLDRHVADERGRRGACRGPRRRRRARRHAQGAQRASARHGACSSPSTPAPTPRSAAWRRRALPAPTPCATGR